MKKIALLLVGVLLVSNLTGCASLKEKYDAFVGKSVETVTPTDASIADEVAHTETVAENEIPTTDVHNPMLDCVANIDSFEGVLTYAVKMQIPMTAEEKKQYESLGNDASYAFHNFNVGAETTIATTDTITHYEGTLSKVGKSIVANPINTYTNETDGIMYDLSYNEQTGSQVWVQNNEYTRSLLTIIKDILGNMQDIKENNGSSTRILKGTVDSTYILQIPCFKNINSEYFTLSADTSAKLPVKVTINTKTGYLAALEVELDNLISAANIQNYSTEPLTIIVKNTNSTLIAIPEEAINTTGEELAVVSDDVSVYGKFFRSIYAPNNDEATDDISVNIIHSVIGTQYDSILLDQTSDDGVTEVVRKVTNFLNYYSVDDLQDYMEYYKYCSDEEQVSICIVAQLGIPGFDESFMQQNCIGNIKLSTIINEYMYSMNMGDATLMNNNFEEAE